MRRKKDVYITKKRLGHADADACTVYCAHHERSTGHWAEQPLGKICHLSGKNRGTPSNLILIVISTLISLKSLGPSPARELFWGGGLKRAVGFG